MADNIARSRLSALAWIAVFLILASETIATLRHVGLLGRRTPLPVAQTVLRILVMAVALGLLCLFRSALERMTLLVAAAAGSTALYGLGHKSAGLSAFRLLSHVAAYALVMVVASRKVATARRELVLARANAESQS